MSGNKLAMASTETMKERKASLAPLSLTHSMTPPTKIPFMIIGGTQKPLSSEPTTRLSWNPKSHPRIPKRKKKKIPMST